MEVILKREDFGYSNILENLRIEQQFGGLVIGGMIPEYKDPYNTKTEEGDLIDDIIGRLGCPLRAVTTFLVVGGWVAFILILSGMTQREYIITCLQARILSNILDAGGILPPEGGI